MILQQAVSVLEGVLTCHERRVLAAVIQAQEDYFDAEPTFKQSFPMPKANLDPQTISRLVTSHKMKKKFAKFDEIPQVESAFKQTAATKTELEVELEQAHEGKEHFKSKEWVKAKEQDDEAIKRNPNDPKIDSNRAAAVQKLMAHPDSFKDQVIDAREAELSPTEFIALQKSKQILACFRNRPEEVSLKACLPGD